MSIKFNANEIRYIALFESMTGAMVKDCIIDDELSKVTFVVKNGDMGLAIGKGGSTVTKVKRAVDKGVEIIEYNEDPAQFIRNILSPAELKSIKVIQKAWSIKEIIRTLSIGNIITNSIKTTNKTAVLNFISLLQRNI